MLRGYLGIDQYGTHYHLKHHPRKELLEYFDRQHADNMYRDRTDGSIHHVGYIIAGHWIEIHEVRTWQRLSRKRKEA